MTKNENLQKDSLTQSKSTTRRKKTEKKPDEEFVKEVQPDGNVIVSEAKHWIIENGVKKCPVCGAQMMGWAYRENFRYCPMCAEQLT